MPGPSSRVAPGRSPPPSICSRSVTPGQGRASGESSWLSSARLPMKKLLLLIVLALLLVSGCEKETPSQAIPNKPPKTYLWLFPDSTIAEGHSSQHIRWWGSDPDGIVKGFLFASGRLPAAGQHFPGNIP